MFDLRLEFPAYPAVSVPVIDLRSDTARPVVCQRAALLVPQVTVCLSVQRPALPVPECLKVPNCSFFGSAPLFVDQTNLRQ